VEWRADVAHPVARALPDAKRAGARGTEAYVNLRRLLGVVALLALSTFGREAAATWASTDMSDLWWASSESGWGVQLVQQADTIFATLFVYGPDGQPTWYSATLLPASNQKFQGDVVRTTGPWFGAPGFQSGAVTRTVVGTMSFAPDKIGTGTLEYTVNGVQVSKSIERQFLAFEDIRGVYAGIASYRGDGLPPCTPNDVANAVATTWTVTGVRQSVKFVAQTTSDTCTYAGPYTQTGRFGQVRGSYACASGAKGDFSFYEMGRDFYAIRARTLVQLPSGCIVNGYIVGMQQPPPFQ
jgi:hypothetical protein